ncbi:50S ribosomal protein L6 [Succinatimonas hippei]|uniref:Large ribosomal subunit protein uL6 n=1 Tax=Succinatimonas hippei (strain DSM 22608 / JCM 16073 / KCTC 15190 / YIT 12066) TaxID=762983 RepID=E8LN84_SUCHY|nr:50S ribosomal protein L6 [Succinatimonas hippei]EFY06032.1 ribosomal protein L6 [Succinatimonas hippei YIT 12066]
MSRIAKEAVAIPQGVEVSVNGQVISAKSKLGQMTLNVHPLVKVVIEDKNIHVQQADDSADSNMQSGTTRALIHNMIVGLDKGFEKKLQLVGVGYRAQAKGKVLNLALGFSHPVEHALPEGVTCETPSQTEIVLKSFDKALLGQVAADIRAYRAPEPYKGKGIRYADEVVRIKEAKKK